MRERKERENREKGMIEKIELKKLAKKNIFGYNLE